MDRSDSRRLAEEDELRDLRAENARLTAALRDAHIALGKAKIARKTAGVLKGVGDLLQVAFVIALLARWITAPSTVDHCYWSSGTLFGNIEWAVDPNFGHYKTAGEAAEAAQKLNCPMLRK